MTGVDDRLDVRVTADAGCLGHMRAAVVGFAQERGWDDTSRVALAVSEAMTNVVLHAYLESPEPGDMRVVACDKPDRLVVVVRDYGDGMRPRTDSPGLGMGLPLITQMTDDLQIEAAQEKGTLLRMHFMKPLAAAA
ncbi:MAG TPA: ATP-binding protein [Solirubrobacteraceae bacterium]|jgi:anti-sigma regulatory factor (Ser/Thr protein kinase)|nr:ATP-binding protein [Solirubrobacteraceae bacterium]